jgi:holo-[acyl-carrier protein] synthase
LIIGTGIDIIEIDRVQKAINRSRKFVIKFFSVAEKEYFTSRNNRSEVIAANFAAKEAFAKAIGTGVRDFSLSDVEVLRDQMGKPYIRLNNNALSIANNNGVVNIHVSISHCKHYAVAYVVLEREE